MPTPDAEAPVARSPLATDSPVRRWLPWALLAVVVVSVLSIAVFGTRSAPTAQDRVMDISKSIKCPVCAGESVAESNAPTSQKIRVDIAEQIQQGRSDDQIRRQLASVYGDEVLLTPSASGVSALVWLIPIVAFAVAVGFLVIVFRRWSVEPTAHASDADRALVAQALARERDQAEPDPDDPHGEGSSR